ncbi:hypothetical protein COV04_03305 [Candidatus Uhrbacteria bacterium CG10_big_fil_rev_8_21_14_0_10_48_11]|uniref:Uncharacterized protein n=1 Tax=Candidatus Uhrbacteria bacterium CG10_big_fil_rev_8_21_14_0_10_48_11 TaxID=1975037 RepID=A0A2M8LE25_9BACT|nr:MAG: hypothetical protein COV04_03305 [Candidatus Uhrbacteria bacterium CG10_big_fil_rev_8_21_14_0_10_48_11]
MLGTLAVTARREVYPTLLKIVLGKVGESRSANRQRRNVHYSLAATGAAKLEELRREQEKIRFYNRHLLAVGGREKYDLSSYISWLESLLARLSR